jgi:hypothetical protein
VPLVAAVKSRPLRAFVALQGFLLLGAWLLPVNGWLEAGWQALAGWVAAAFLILGVRWLKLEGRLGWYAIAAGVALNASGALVEMVAWRRFQITTNPNAADLFWLALYPGLMIGIGGVVRRRAVHEDLETTMLNTAVCLLLNLFLGIFAWEFIVWRTQSDPSLTLANRLIVTVYPLADLMLVALLMRLVLGGGLRNASFAMLVLGLAFLLVADILWSGFLRNGTEPTVLTKHVLHSSSMLGRASLVAAALHPSVRALAPGATTPDQRLGFFGWTALGASVLTAPLVIALQAILDRLYSVTSF